MTSWLCEQQERPFWGRSIWDEIRVAENTVNAKALRWKWIEYVWGKAKKTREAGVCYVRRILWCESLLCLSFFTLWYCFLFVWLVLLFFVLPQTLISLNSKKSWSVFHGNRVQGSSQARELDWESWHSVSLPPILMSHMFISCKVRLWWTYGLSEIQPPWYSHSSVRSAIVQSRP